MSCLAALWAHIPGVDGKTLHHSKFPTSRVVLGGLARSNRVHRMQHRAYRENEKDLLIQPSIQMVLGLRESFMRVMQGLQKA